jgi:hypothetical protein
MAKLQSLPDSATIMAFRQRVDFYLWKGMPVARRWPVANRHRVRTKGEIASSQQFAVAAYATGLMPAAVRNGFQKARGGAGWTWVDAFRAGARGKSWWVASQ